MMARWKQLLLAAVMGFSFFVPVSVGAQSIIQPPAGACSEHPEATLCKDSEVDQTLDSNSIFGKNGILTKAAKVVTIVVGVASVIMIISSGIQYAISSGDPARLNRAKDTLLYALIGVLVAVTAQIIIIFVLNEVG